ncbi:helix-turn-helix domain-containing protein [Rhodococcus opacus]|uniref:helix-turn-helix domain-containing protein n=1 Tax=Rhodococcus opacus TaxID=37919 RepID=UPI0024771D1B|nr:helix-turn-helix domain-containing protein [Rhodococcus opacus]
MATDLVGVVDRTGILTVLCRRFRNAFGVNSAYAALNVPEASEAVVRSSLGIRTEEFRALQLPHGVGLGGVVAVEGQVRASGDYPSDQGLRHTELLDARVRREGLHAIIAAPLREGGALVGAILAGARFPRNFTDTDLALAASLSDMASVALTSAAKVNSLRERVQELEQTQSRPGLIGNVAARRSALLAHLASDACRDEGCFARRAAAAGISPAAEFCVMAVELPMYATPDAVTRTCEQIIQIGGMALADDGLLLALTPPDGPTVTQVRSAVQGEHHIGPNSAASRPASGAGPLVDALDRARLAVQLLTAVGRRGSHRCSDDVGPLALLAASIDQAVLSTFISRVLGPLEDLEPARQHRLKTTLDAWTDHGGAPKKIARALSLHVNTVYDRLDQLEEVLGPRWSSGPRRLEFETAVHLDRLVNGDSVEPAS